MATPQKGFDIEAMLRSLMELAKTQEQILKKNHEELIAGLKKSRGEVKAKFKTELVKNKDEFKAECKEFKEQKA